jgi:hypothetical protein
MARLLSDSCATLAPALRPAASVARNTGDYKEAHMADAPTINHWVMLDHELTGEERADS